VVSRKFIEQFGELKWFGEQPSRAEEAAEKLNTGGAIDEEHELASAKRTPEQSG
jgi:hypothetical protein